MATRDRQPVVWWGAVLTIAAALLLGALAAKSLWVDEWFTVQVAQKDDLGDLLRYCIEEERRPPLHFLLMHYWLGIAGESDFALRLPSVVFALLGLALTGRLARLLGLGRLAVVAMLLLAIAPTFVLYSRMARAYSMALAVGLWSTVCFIEVVRQPSRRSWLGYLASSVVLLYTDYALLSILLAQNLYVLFAALTPRVSPSLRLRIPAWLAGQAVLLLAFGPWLATLIAQVQRGKIEADFARGLVGYLLKLAYPVLSLSAGETIFPWHAAAILGIVCIAALFLAGVWTLLCAHRDAGVFLLLFLFVPFLFTAILLSSVATDITFINMASRTLFAMPFFALILAAGLLALPVRPWRIVAVLIVAVAWGAALANYYSGRDFHNPIYVVPMREIVQEVAAAAGSGDVIVSDVDSVFGYYYARIARSRATAPHFLSASEAEAARQAITGAHSPRVWLVTLGRDRTRIDAPGDLFAAWLDQGYRLAERRGYAREDDVYQRLKEMLLKRADYEYKAEVRLYVRR